MKKSTGLTYLILAMLAFAGLGLEVVLAFFLEPLLYHAPMQSWTDLQNISHWIITCAVWGLLGWASSILPGSGTAMICLKRRTSLPRGSGVSSPCW